jgi:molecular chaperone DnaK
MNAESDKQAKEDAEVINQADSLIFQVEKTMKDMEDKLSEEQKTDVNEKLQLLKEAHEKKDVEEVKTKMENLNLTFQNITQQIYSQAQQQSDEDVSNDVEFEEVKSN